MICKYQELTRLEMEQVDRENTIVLIPLGALEQHGNQAPLGTNRYHYVRTLIKIHSRSKITLNVNLISPTDCPDNILKNTHLSKHKHT